MSNWLPVDEASKNHKGIRIARCSDSENCTAHSHQKDEAVSSFSQSEGTVQ